MSAPGAYNVPPIVVEQHGGLYEVLQGGAHLVEREVRFEARAQMSPQGAPDPECGLRPVRISPVSVSLFPPLGNPTPQADRGACGHTIPRWPCTGLLMIGESVAGLSRRLRVSFGVESQDPPYPPNCVFCGKNAEYAIIIYLPLAPSPG